MTKEEFDKRMREIGEEAERQKRILEGNYAISNNPYKVGDIIEDHIGKGRILSMGIYKGLDKYPGMVYKCDNLTRKGEINKKEPKRDIYQRNIINT